MSVRLWRKEQAGDTIIEVLLAIAVVSAVLGGAYSAARHSAQITRTAQERGEALQLMQAQMELLKATAIRDNNAIFGPAAPTNFCFNASGAVVGSGAPDCVQQPQGGVAYRLSIQRATSGPTRNVFTGLARWDGGTSGTTHEVQLITRVH